MSRRTIGKGVRVPSRCELVELLATLPGVGEDEIVLEAAADTVRRVFRYPGLDDVSLMLRLPKEGWQVEPEGSCASELRELSRRLEGVREVLGRANLSGSSPGPISGDIKGSGAGARHDGIWKPLLAKQLGWVPEVAWSVGMRLNRFEGGRLMEVVKATQADLDSILAWLEREFHEENESGFWHNRRIIADALDRGDLWVIRRRGEAVAYQVGDYAAAISNVRKDWQRKGLGTTLLHASVERAYRDNVNILEGEYSPRTSLPFWEKHGFVRYGDLSEQAFRRLRIG